MTPLSFLLATLLHLTSLGALQDFPNSVDKTPLSSQHTHETITEVSENNLVTLRYYDANTPSTFIRFFGPTFTYTGILQRISSPVSGRVNSIVFPIQAPGEVLSSGNVTVGVGGTGVLRIKLFETPGNDPNNFPNVTEQPLAAKEVDFTELVAESDFTNVISLAEENFNIEQGNEYWLGLFVEDSSNDARIDFVSDQGSENENDTNYFPARTLNYSAINDELRPDQGFGDSNPNLFIDITLEELQPFISHAPPNQITIGEPLTIQAPVVDDLDLTNSVTLLYRTGDNPVMQELPLSPSTGSIYSAVIEGSAISTSGLQYQIRLTSDGVAPKTLGPFSPAVRIENEGLTYSLPVFR